MIQFVDSFRALATAAYPAGGNALGWARTLAGDFAEVVAQLGPGEGVVRLDEARLRGLKLKPAGAAAVDVMLADFQRLEAAGLAPELNLIHAYPKDTDDLVATDVFSWHVDRATEPADTWLCTYYGAPSEALPNAEAIRRVDEPATRAALLQRYGGADDADFPEWLSEHSYDLHYRTLPGARPYAFGVGQLWRIAADYPDSLVPPCIHRAPATTGPRLLLIA